MSSSSHSASKNPLNDTDPLQKGGQVDRIIDEEIEKITTICLKNTLETKEQIIEQLRKNNQEIERREALKDTKISELTSQVARLKIETANQKKSIEELENKLKQKDEQLKLNDSLKSGY